MKKKMFFVINTMGQGGAEMALLELLRKLSPEQFDISLLVLLGQGELIHRLPEYVKVLNQSYDDTSVLTDEGRAHLKKNLLKIFFRRGALFRAIPYLTKQLLAMVKKKRLMPDKLLWRVAAMGAPKVTEHYDMAVAYLEGGSAYYVADYVDADVKAAFIHIDYLQAGYNRSLDDDCYLKYNKVFCVSEEVRQVFASVYPECCTDVFHNLVNQKEILDKSREPGGFADDYRGIRIMTVGRLNIQKAFEVSIRAMRLVKDEGIEARWYVFGEGDERSRLEAYIKELGLEKDFLLPGVVTNPYPYYAQTNLYVHASRFEGKSIAIQEAQTLGCAILVSDCSGNREQVVPEVDGLMCDFTAEAIKEGIIRLLRDDALRQRLGEAAAKKHFNHTNDLNKLLDMMK